jgi:hypothetical protein
VIEATPDLEQTGETVGRDESGVANVLAALQDFDYLIALSGMLDASSTNLSDS